MPPLQRVDVTDKILSCIEDWKQQGKKTFTIGELSRDSGINKSTVESRIRRTYALTPCDSAMNKSLQITSRYSVSELEDRIGGVRG